MKIRCSALPQIMTKPKLKGEKLSETAKSYIKKTAKEDFYGYQSTLTNKYVQKGIDVENEAIELYNEVNFTDFKKNTERKENDFLTGECDLFTGEKIIDIKSSWSLETFPSLPEDINIKDYEMQLRGYMMLWDCEEAEVAYCMVSTPEELCKWENQDIHQVDHIEPQYRVTTFQVKRDAEIEQEIEERCTAAIEYYIEYINKLNNKQMKNWRKIILETGKTMYQVSKESGVSPQTLQNLKKGKGISMKTYEKLEKWHENINIGEKWKSY